MSDDITGAVTGMIPTVLAVGILKRTTDAMLPTQRKAAPAQVQKKKGFGLGHLFKK
jgi:hypothetical protein